MIVSNSIKKIVYFIFLHTVLAWGAISLAYNSYKEYFKHTQFFYLPNNIKNDIKNGFPLFIVSFTLLALCCFLWKKKLNELTIKTYLAVLVIHGGIINMFFFSDITAVILVLNLSLFYLFLLIIIWVSLTRKTTISSLISPMPVNSFLTDCIPPIMIKTGHRLKSLFFSLKSTGRESPSRLMAICYAATLFLGLIFLFFNQEKSARQFVDFGFFLFLASIAWELFSWRKK